jgi:hypothetical protein
MELHSNVAGHPIGGTKSTADEESITNRHSHPVQGRPVAAPR